jgi:hypothetical protein
MSKTNSSPPMSCIPVSGSSEAEGEIR